jgi:hypothetical protein
LFSIAFGFDLSSVEQLRLDRAVQSGVSEALILIGGRTKSKTSLKQDGQQDDDPFHHVLMVARNILRVHEVADYSKNKNANNGIQSGSAASHQTGASDYDRSDDIEFHPGTDHRRTDSGTSSLDCARERAQSAGDHFGLFSPVAP